MTSIPFGSLDGTDLGGGYDGLGEGNFNSHDAILQEALSDQSHRL